MNVHEVLTRCRDLGVILAASPDGKLRATPPGKLPEELREQLRRCKAEVLALLTLQQQPAPSPDYRALYQQMAETVRGDCFPIDPHWLIDAHPELWEQIVALDATLSQLEQASAAEP